MRFHFAFISAIVAWRAASVPVNPAEKGFSSAQILESR